MIRLIGDMSLCLQISPQDCFNPLTATACNNFTGEKCWHATANSIFSCPITNHFQYCASVLMEALSHANAKMLSKEIQISHFYWSFSSDTVAGKGLIFFASLCSSSLPPPPPPRQHLPFYFFLFFEEGP